MRHRLTGVLVAMSAFTAPCTAHAQAPPPRPLVIVGARVLPMTRDTVLEHHTILVRDGRIAWLGPAGRAPRADDAVRVDAAGAFVIPGLADMHVHLLPDAPAGALSAYVAAGITTVRNMRGDTTHLGWRRDIAARRLVGPRIYTAGPGVGRGLLGNRAFVRVTDARQAERVVEAQRRAGFDMVKVFNRIPAEAFAALGGRARAVGIPVVGHVVSDVGIARSIAAGQVSFEHVDAFLQGSAEQMARDAAQMARAGVWAGTIVSDREGGCRAPTPSVREAITTLRRSGVRLLVGSDAGIGPVRAGEGLHCELRTLVAAGVSPFEALAAATRDAGDFARTHLREQEAFGTVAVGARADLILLDADPRRDLRALERLRGVVVRGAWRARSGR